MLTALVLYFCWKAIRFLGKKPISLSSNKHINIHILGVVPDMSSNRKTDRKKKMCFVRPLSVGAVAEGHNLAEFHPISPEIWWFSTLSYRSIFSGCDLPNGTIVAQMFNWHRYICPSFLPQPWLVINAQWKSIRTGINRFLPLPTLSTSWELRRPLIDLFSINCLMPFNCIHTFGPNEFHILIKLREQRKPSAVVLLTSNRETAIHQAEKCVTGGLEVYL